MSAGVGAHCRGAARGGDPGLQVGNGPQELDSYGTRVRTRLGVLTPGRALEWVRRGRAAEAAGAEGADAHRGEPGGFSDGEALATAGRVQGALAVPSPGQRLALEVPASAGTPMRPPR